ncbi:MAG: MBL fold metallo-hydrolase, partial [Calditrichaeota bacterium]
MLKLTFLGATQTVTGSRFLIQYRKKKILIDCGLFQGTKQNRLRNWDPFPISPDSIDSVFLTHAHIDHTGYLPRFCKDGFTGKIYATRATHALCELLLRDSAHLQEEDAAWANKKGFSRHKPALPLYTVQDAENSLDFFHPVNYGDDIFIDSAMRFKYRDAGHILGSTFIDVKVNTPKGYQKIVFSGDLGRPRREVLRDPSQPFNVDYLVLESTYGNRLHEDNHPEEQLAKVINESVERGGVLLIPAFAVGRTQTLLFVIRELEKSGKIPTIPVFVDSPMAIDTTKIFRQHIAEMNISARVLTLQGEKI